MTLEELLQTVEENKTTQEDVLKYFEVRNLDGLEIILEEKAAKPVFRLEFINESFEYIYAARNKEKYNPIEEEFFSFLAALPGLFDIEPEEINAIAKGLGLMETIIMLDKIFSKTKEFKYFEKMYAKYVAEKTNMYKLLDRSINELTKFLDDKIGNLNMDDLKKMGDELVSGLSKIKPE
jgi:hypothetical protein